MRPFNRATIPSTKINQDLSAGHLSECTLAYLRREMLKRTERLVFTHNFKLTDSTRTR